MSALPSSTDDPPFARWLLRLGWLALPLACHLGFSWIGFNPTDDGWLQAVARRMLNGEFPHRDFISVRPVLSAILQIPLVWAGGEYTIWLSRLWGWLTIGGLAWIWSGLVLPGGAPALLRPLLYTVAFLLTAHVFPVMAWHTLDGMLLASLAVWFAARGALRRAFVCAGLAALCRQNFALFAPLLVLACPGPRPQRWRAMWWAALPPAIYLVAALLAGTLRDFFLQALATGSRFSGTALGTFGRNPGFLWALLAGTVGAIGLHLANRRSPVIAHGVSLAVVAAGTVLAAVGLWQGSLAYHNFSFRLFGYLAGLVVAGAILRRSLPDADRLLFVAGIGLAWVTAISIGYNSPALAAGVLLLLLWRTVLHPPGAPLPRTNATLLTALGSLIAIGATFGHARMTYPYRDRAAGDLRFEVGPVLRGGAGLRTNELTYSVLVNLRQLTDRYEAEGRPYVILTDGAAAWIRSPRRNLLPCEWPQETELGYNPELVGKSIGAIRRLPPDTHIIVQRVLISELSHGLYAVPPGWSYYFVQNWVAGQCPKLETAGFFEIYGPPAPARRSPKDW